MRARLNFLMRKRRARMEAAMFQCRDFLALPTMAKARIIAGNEGLQNGIRWAYKAETMDFSKWVHGQELLIISTLVIQSDDFDLYTILKDAIRHRMSGALMLVGENYIEQIDSKVIRLADRNRFPLIAIPWDVPLLDIFEELGHAIAWHDHIDDSREDLMAHIIFGNQVPASAIKLSAEMVEYDMELPQQIFVFHFFIKEYTRNKSSAESDRENIAFLPKEDMNEILAVLSSLFQKREIPMLLSFYSSNLVGIMRASFPERSAIEEIVAEFCGYLAKEKEGVCCYIGFGNPCEKIAELQSSYQSASKCIALAERLNREQEILWYDRLGFYRFLLSCEDEDSLKEYQHEILQDILRYDEENHTRLLDTLRTYFSCNCSLQETSEKMYTHRNTIKYRMQRIEKLTGRSFHNSFDSLEFYNAVLIHDFFQ